MRRRLVVVALLGPVLGALFLACAPKPKAPDDGWTPALAPVDASGDAGAAHAAAPREDLATELADASDSDVANAFKDRVTKIGPQHWRIARAAYELLFANDAHLVARAFRIVPEVLDGAPAGLRLFGIRPDGVGFVLGLQNGDRIQAINGAPMGAPEQVMTVWAGLAKASHVEVVVVRAGKPLTLTYDISDP